MRSRLAKWPQEGDLARTAPAPTSKHLKHVIGRPGCRARPARNTANAVHPRVCVRAGLKVWRGPKIVEASIDGFASIEAIDHVLGAVAESLVSHIDHLLVVRLERKSDVKLQHAVTSQQEPIAAARQHLALLPPENATGNFVKVVQRLPVRIELEAYDPNENPLFVGTSVVPYVYLNKPLTGPDAGKFLQTVAPQSQIVGPSQSSIGAHK